MQCELEQLGVLALLAAVLNYSSRGTHSGMQGTTSRPIFGLTLNCFYYNRGTYSMTIGSFPSRRATRAWRFSFGMLLLLLLLLLELVEVLVAAVLAPLSSASLSSDDESKSKMASSTEAAAAAAGTDDLFNGGNFFWLLGSAVVELELCEKVKSGEEEGLGWGPPDPV